MQTISGEAGPHARADSQELKGAEEQALTAKDKFGPFGSKNYLTHWTVQTAQDEYVQNFFDQCVAVAKRLGCEHTDVKCVLEGCSNIKEYTKRLPRGAMHLLVCCSMQTVSGWKTFELGRLVFDPEGATLTLVNYATRLYPMCFYFGHSGDEKAAHGSDSVMRGKFGDGLPSSTLVFTRADDLDVDILSCGYRYKFFMQDDIGVNSMFFSLSPDDAIDKNDTRVTLSGLHTFDDTRYLFFQAEVEKYAGKRVEILKEETCRHRIYVKGMLVKMDTRADGIHFGMNLLTHDMQSRDRQETIPVETMQESIIQGWAEATEDTPEACADLFKLICEHGDAMEAMAMKNATGNRTASQIKEKIALEFARQHPGGFPIREGDSRSTGLVQEKLKMVPVPVGATLFAILRASDKVFTDAAVAWDDKRKEMIETAEPLEMKEPWLTVFKMVCSAFRGIFPLDMSRFEVVNCPDLEDVSGMLLGQGVEEFEISGFKERPCFNSTFKRRSDKLVDRQATFWADGDQLFLYLRNEMWIGTYKMYYDTVLTGDQCREYIKCNNREFWAADTEWSEYSTSDEEYVRASDVCIRPKNESSELLYTIHINEVAMRTSVHDKKADDFDVVCDFSGSKCCLCVFRDLVDMLFSDLRRQLRVTLSGRQRKKVDAKLSQIVLDRDFRHAFSKKLQVLFPTPRRVADSSDDDDDDGDDATSNVRSYLRTGVPSMDETESDRALRRKIDSLVEEGLLVKPEVSSTTQAWVGDRVLDFYESLLGREENLQSKFLQQVSSTLFSAKNLGGGLGRQFSEEKEEDIGAAISAEDQSAIMKVLEPIMRRQHITNPDSPSREDSVSNLVRRHIVQAKQRQDACPAPEPAARRSGHRDTDCATHSGKKDDGTGQIFSHLRPRLRPMRDCVTCQTEFATKFRGAHPVCPACAPPGRRGGRARGRGVTRRGGGSRGRGPAHGHGSSGLFSTQRVGIR